MIQSCCIRLFSVRIIIFRVILNVTVISVTEFFASEVTRFLRASIHPSTLSGKVSASGWPTLNILEFFVHMMFFSAACLLTWLR